jgi:hypothetical protein
MMKTGFLVRHKNLLAVLPIDTTVGIEGYGLDTIVFNAQKYFNRILAFSGPLSISIRTLQSFSSVIAKSHFQVMERMITPKIKFILNHFYT